MARIPDSDFPPDRPTSARPRVLLLEDNDVQADALAAALNYAGYDCEVALSVAVARAALVREDGPAFAVLITDLMLGEVDGVAIIQEARALPRYTALPAIVTTGRASTATQARVVALGRAELLAKPYPLASIFSLLARWTDRTQEEA